MPVLDIDFEGGSQTDNNVPPTQQTNQPANNGGDQTTPLNHEPDVTDINNQTPPPSNEPNNQPQPPVDNSNSSTGGLSEGDTVEFEGATYTTDANGNLVDDKGNIFKNANEVKAWLDEVDATEETSTEEPLSLNAIQEALGTTILGEDGKAIEFTNDANGVKSYINSVIEVKSNELQEAAVNKLFADNPMLKQFMDYVQLNGTPRGFGEIPDRSGIELDKDNIPQLEAVIKMAAEEFGNKSLSASYIKYLRDSGGLYDVAKEQLAALIEKDNQVRVNMEQQAKAQREQEAIDTQNYWNSIKSAIDKRVINGFKLPESYTKEVDGKKIVLTPNDFYNYLSRPSVTLENGARISAYQADLNKLSDEEYQSNEILTAWLMFTGSSYKDLVKMLQDETKVQHLKLKAKEQQTAKSVKVIRKAAGKVNPDDIVLS